MISRAADFGRPFFVMSTKPVPELMADAHCQLGEGPLWVAEEGAIYWVDILRGGLLRSHERGQVETLFCSGLLGGITRQVILGGGEGKRWGGPKAWAPLPDGRSFLEACASPIVPMS